MSDLIIDEVSMALTSVDHGEELLEVEEKMEIPVSNLAATDYNNVLSTVDHREEILEVGGLKEEEVNHEIQEEVIVPENIIVLNTDDHGEDMAEANELAKSETEIKIPLSNLVHNIGFSKFNHEEEKLTDVDARVEREMKNKVLKYLPNMSDHGEEVLEVEEKSEIPVSNLAATDYNNVLSTVDHREEILEVSGLKEEEVNHEIQVEVIVPENIIVLNTDDHGEDMVEANELAKSETEIKIPLSNLVHNIGLSKFNHEEEKLTDVDPLIESKMKNRVLKYLPNLIINSVKRVENNFLSGMYYLKKEEYQSRNIDVKEKILFHATAAMNVDSIIKDNFDWKRSKRCKYGSGVSFATDADYANCHSNRHNGNNRAFIIAKVLVGNSTEGSSHLIIPDEGFDTTTGANGIVVVKYNHNEYLPLYVVYYDYYDISKSKYFTSRRSNNWSW